MDAETEPETDPGADFVVGPVRRPTNVTYQEKGSIHDDETARRLGLRGGTIAASTHLDQFPPVLTEAFGQQWFETGSLSLYFRHATTDGEPVQAFVGRPTAGLLSAQTVAEMRTDDGTVVAEGTAAIGAPTEPTALSARDLRHDAAGLRILAGLSQGFAFEPLTRRIDFAAQSARIDQGLLTEPLDCYRDKFPWVTAIAAPSSIIDMLTKAASSALLHQIGEAVGLWGAFEIRNVNGPVLVDTDYTVTGRVVALGSSPKTEILWYDMEIHDGDRVVATMRNLTRFMKASSALHAQPD